MKYRSRIMVCLSGMLVMAAQSPAEESLSPEQKSAVEEVVRQMLQEQPELVVEAIQAWRDKQTRLEEERRRQAIGELHQSLGDSQFPYLGNAQGGTVIVEFSDYNCPYCKRTFTAISELVESDGDLKVVMLELPVLGPVSEIAARAALASHRQGKYAVFHGAMMQVADRLSENTILKVAGSVGLNVEQLQQDMNSPGVSEELKRNQVLAAKLGISGTPAFVIGEREIPGAVDKKRLETLIAGLRSK